MDTFPGTVRDLDGRVIGSCRIRIDPRTGEVTVADLPTLRRVVGPATLTYYPPDEAQPPDPEAVTAGTACPASGPGPAP